MGPGRYQSHISPMSTIVNDPANADLKLKLDHVFVEIMDWDQSKKWHGELAFVLHCCLSGLSAVPGGTDLIPSCIQGLVAQEGVDQETAQSNRSSRSAPPRMRSNLYWYKC